MINSNEELVNFLIDNGVLKTPSIIDAFMAVDRKDFVPIDMRYQAYENNPLPIGYGQTISQPWTVAFMLELLKPEYGHNVLDIGSGSGYQAALLAKIVGDNGCVISLDIIPELRAMALKNNYKYGFVTRGILEFHCLSAEFGYEDKAPFDRIISAASGSKVPEIWLEELKINGRLVVPIDSEIKLMKKITADKFEEESYQGFSFVPFINKKC
ncbi:MAG TPA: protein-L-isoaspartate O-methyltransferase [Candidatus Vogelbacteria bacterium]|nr:protein-L-isoaspartate O-methyltransferase [Candidatus Vogelbacteria bacterium]